ncbi:methionyl-tRNA formyltransferase [Candidatus Rariloculus sp.]|uniref:methionyl-tRNA formyltransferase n=1 Tax=Candidatus Rariloculus sp. TaxID=3101265 RepID=UPI003D0EBA89
MRLIVNGQQAFGKSVLDGLLDRSEEVVGVYCAPERPGARPDPLKETALERGLPVFQPSSYRKEEVCEQMASLKPDLCVMAYVTLFVPEQALTVPTQGTIQFHPSLLPRHRGPSSINWPIIWGETQTGLSIFWPDDGLDEGPILIQKTIDIGDEDTVGSLYFNQLYPMGVAATLEGVDLVRAGNAPRIEQNPGEATYEGWCRRDLVKINWHMPLQTVWNLVRGANPQPGAWSTFEGETVNIYDARKIPEALSVQPGQVTALDDESVTVATADGQLRLLKVRPQGGKKIGAGEWAAEAGIAKGARLGV